MKERLRVCCFLIFHGVSQVISIETKDISPFAEIGDRTIPYRFSVQVIAAWFSLILREKNAGDCQGHLPDFYCNVDRDRAYQCP